ncbi:Uncharacterized protein Fot_04134 [Forsythia ovata]|uniref:Uncharacterized protein n=1 Tax=Forsythia ovata TaxID=205694 RepID=A0ABD1XBP1_9LAMI
MEGLNLLPTVKFSRKHLAIGEDSTPLRAPQSRPHWYSPQTHVTVEAPHCNNRPSHSNILTKRDPRRKINKGSNGEWFAAIFLKLAGASNLVIFRLWTLEGSKQSLASALLRLPYQARMGRRPLSLGQFEGLTNFGNHHF